MGFKGYASKCTKAQESKLHRTCVIFALPYSPQDKREQHEQQPESEEPLVK